MICATTEKKAGNRLTLRQTRRKRTVMRKTQTAHRHYHAVTDLYACIATIRPDRIDPGRLKAIISAFSGTSDDIIDSAVREGMTGFLYVELTSDSLPGRWMQTGLDCLIRLHFTPGHRQLAF